MPCSPVLLWFLLGAVLLICELLAPGIILVFFGIGAWIAALTAYLNITASFESQLLVFAASSIMLLIILRRIIKAQMSGYVSNVQDPGKNLDEFIGKEVVVLQTILPGRHDGQVEFKGASWGAVSDEEIKTNETAIITGTEGIILKIKKPSAA